MQKYHQDFLVISGKCVSLVSVSNLFMNKFAKKGDNRLSIAVPLNCLTFDHYDQYNHYVCNIREIII